MKNTMRSMFSLGLIVGLFAAGCGSDPIAGESSIADAGTDGAKKAGSISSSDASDTSGGACLLFYNSALASGDPCCYRQNDTNTCDTSITCNEAAGEGCCLIYASQNTSGGQRCCLYVSGRYGDGASECKQLLAQSR